MVSYPEIGKVREALEAAGWTTYPDVSGDKVFMHYENNSIGMTVTFIPTEQAPHKFCWRFITTDVVDIFIDYGDKLDDLIATICKYDPEITPENYLDTVASLASAFPSVYKLEDGKDQQLIPVLPKR